MLTFLRSAAGTFIAKILLGLLILSFGVWGITGASFNFASGSLGSVGSSKISTADFQREYLLEINRLSRQFNRQITPTQARQFGIDRQVLGRMINQATLSDRANAFGLGVSDDRIADEVLKDPTFLNARGDFDAYRYQQLISSAGLSENQFLSQQRQAYEQQQIIDTFAGDVALPNAMKDALSAHTNEKRAVDYLMVDVRDIKPISPPDDSTLETYFNSNKASYRAPEYRSIEYLSLRSADLGGAERISDTDARAYYEKSKDQFTTKERRRIRRINFDSEAKARDAILKLQAGTSFDNLVTELGLQNQDVELGLLPKEEVLDTKLADAAFTLKVQTPSEIIDGDFGKAIVFVDEIQGGSTQTFEQLSQTIKGQIAADENNRELLEKLDQIEDARAAGSTFPEVANKFKLKLIKVTDAAQSGDLKTGGQISETTPALNDLLDETFKSEIGIENDVIEIGRDGFLWYEVTDIEAARDRTFSEVKDQVKTDWTRNEVQKAILDKAEAVAKELDAGKSIHLAAQELGREAERVSDIKRNQPVNGLSGAAVSLIFKGAEGFVTTAPGETDNQTLVLQVARITKDTTKASSEVLANLKAAVQNDVIETYIRLVQEREGLSINPEAVEFATDLDGQRGYGNQGGHN